MRPLFPFWFSGLYLDVFAARVPVTRDGSTVELPKPLQYVDESNDNSRQHESSESTEEDDSNAEGQLSGKESCSASDASCHASGMAMNLDSTSEIEEQKKEGEAVERTDSQNSPKSPEFDFLKKLEAEVANEPVELQKRKPARADQTGLDTPGSISDDPTSPKEEMGSQVNFAKGAAPQNDDEEDFYGTDEGSDHAQYEREISSLDTDITPFEAEQIFAQNKWLRPAAYFLISVHMIRVLLFVVLRLVMNFHHAQGPGSQTYFGSVQEATMETPLTIFLESVNKFMPVLGIFAYIGALHPIISGMPHDDWTHKSKTRYALQAKFIIALSPWAALTILWFVIYLRPEFVDGWNRSYDRMDFVVHWAEQAFLLPLIFTQASTWMLDEESQADLDPSKTPEQHKWTTFSNWLSVAYVVPQGLFIYVAYKITQVEPAL